MVRIVEYQPKVTTRIAGSVPQATVLSNIALGVDSLLTHAKGQVPIALSSTVNSVLARGAGDIEWFTISNLRALLDITQETHIDLVALATEESFS